jgi:hypothetical protein
MRLGMIQSAVKESCSNLLTPAHGERRRATRSNLDGRSCRSANAFSGGHPRRWRQPEDVTSSAKTRLMTLRAADS